MLVLLPVESDQLGVTIAAAVGMVVFILWAVPQLYPEVYEHSGLIRRRVGLCR